MNFLCVKMIYNILVVFSTVKFYICVFMTCSTTYCIYYKLMDPWNVCMYAYMCVCVCTYVCVYVCICVRTEQTQAENSSVLWILSCASININLLKPTGHVMHQQFNIQQLYALLTLYLCVLYLSENKQRIVPLTA
jgi:hypothetical protein